MVEVECWRCDRVFLIGKGDANAVCPHCGERWNVEWTRGLFGWVASLFSERDRR